jgi:putative ABC transport system permease protein
VSFYRIILRSLGFYWRTNLGVLLAAMVSTGILTGALAVGDSVRHSLQAQAKERLGTTELALATANRFFTEELADELATQLNNHGLRGLSQMSTDSTSVKPVVKVAPVLQVRGLMADSNDVKRANNVQVLGVDERFFEVGPGKNPLVDSRSLLSQGQVYPRASSLRSRFGGVGSGGGGWTDGIIMNESLAARLGARAGDEVLLRIEKPGVMSRDVPIAPDSDLTVASRLVIKAVAGRSEFGSFSLQANQIAPLNVFVPIRWLQDKLGRPAQANMLLVAANPEDSRRRAKTAMATARVTLERADIALKECWRLADAGLELRRLDVQQCLELRSRRIFIDEVVADAAMNVADGAVGVLTYFVNELRCGDKTTPYSMVTAMSRGSGSPIATGMSDDEILINQWLADDLEAKVGDSIELVYFVIGSARKLQEQKSTFRVRGVLPMQPDPELMPEFPGLAKVENCRDWDRGIPIDLSKIRKRDEDYWDRYRGTPKAFITLAAGQKLWANRFGSLTAVRYPAPRLASGDGGASPPADNSAQSITERLTAGVDPASVGLFFGAVRQRGMEAANNATDFSRLFLGLSIFLIVAAVILMGLIFVFGVQSRSEQIGMLRAVGFPPRLVRRLLLAEGGTLAVIGAIAGTAAGLLYTKVMIYALATGWQQAVGGSTIEFYAEPLTLFEGAAVSVAVSMIAIWLTVRKQSSLPARELLAGSLRWQFFTAGPPGRPASRPEARGLGEPRAGRQTRNPAINWGAKYYLARRGGLPLLLAAVTAIGAVVIVFSVGGGDSTSVSAAFFAGGALLLIAGLALTAALLQMIAGSWKKPVESLSGLGLRNSTRRSGRSLAVVGLLASGTFLVIAVGANRQNPLARADRRDSGTGGFALYGESAVPVLSIVDFQLSIFNFPSPGSSELEGVSIVPMRLHEGDDASCLNLNKAQKPRLLAVQPEQLAKRGAFAFRAGFNSAAGQRQKTEDRKQKTENRKQESVGRPPSSVPRPPIHDSQFYILNSKCEDENVVPAIGDYPTIVWSLGKSVGDELEYVDEMGRKFRLRLVGMMKSSILQGSLLISESNFTQRFPSEEGYRVFLIDAPPGQAEQVGERLSARLKDFGLALTLTTDRLAEFSTVENTYLSIFQLLGGLGLILGTVGLALVVLRNMLDRRGELAMLRAVGFNKAAVGRMVFYEHWLLCLWGLTCGVTAALVAVKPAVSSPAAQIPYVSLALTVAAIALSAAVWICLATASALSGKMLDALRNE